MKIVSEVKPIPTFKAYIDSGEFTVGAMHDITLVLYNEDWKTITFFAEAFKLNHKVKNSEEFNKLYRSVSKVLNKECKAFLEVESTTVCNVHLNLASDADEDFHRFKSTERGWEKTR